MRARRERGAREIRKGSFGEKEREEGKGEGG